MRTLFLNPNSSEEITSTLRHQVERCGWPADRWEVLKVDEALRIIGSASQNAKAEAAVELALPVLSQGFDRVVMMSSVDTAPAGIFVTRHTALRAACSRSIAGLASNSRSSPSTRRLPLFTKMPSRLPDIAQLLPAGRLSIDCRQNMRLPRLPLDVADPVLLTFGRPTSAGACRLAVVADNLATGVSMGRRAQGEIL